MQALTRARLGSLAIVLLISGAIGMLDDRLIAYAGLAGTATLLTAFTLGILQGLGRPRSAAALYCVQALLYLGVVAIWGRDAPASVIAAFIASYAVTLVLSLVAVSMAMPRAAVPDLRDRSWNQTTPSEVRSTLRSSRRPYVLVCYSLPTARSRCWRSVGHTSRTRGGILDRAHARDDGDHSVGHDRRSPVLPRICALVAAGSAQAVPGLDNSCGC